MHNIYCPIPSSLQAMNYRVIGHSLILIHSYLHPGTNTVGKMLLIVKQMTRSFNHASFKMKGVNNTQNQTKTST